MKGSCIFIPLASGLLFLLSGCGDGVVPAGSDSARQASRAAPVQTAREVLFGDVVVQAVAGSADIVVSLDGGARPGLADGDADRMYVLQREPGAQPAVRSRIENARLLYEGGSLLLVPSRGDAVGLFLNDRTRPTAGAKSFLEGARLGTSWVGVGMSRRIGEWPLEAHFLGDATLRKALSTCGSPLSLAGDIEVEEGADTADADAKLTCDSGGPGSTSCNAGGSCGCSTNCGTGYYACCDAQACKCQCVKKSGSSLTPDTASAPGTDIGTDIGTASPGEAST